MYRRLLKSVLATVALSASVGNAVFAQDDDPPPASIESEKALPKGNFRFANANEDEASLSATPVSAMMLQEPVQPAAPLPTTPTELPPAASQLFGTIFTADGIERSGI